MKTTAILVSLFCFILTSCGSDDHNGGGNDQDGDYNLKEEIRKVLNSTKATKNINPFDELGVRNLSYWSYQCRRTYQSHY